MDKIIVTLVRKLKVSVETANELSLAGYKSVKAVREADGDALAKKVKSITKEQHAALVAGLLAKREKGKKK